MAKKRLPTQDEAAIGLKIAAANAREMLDSADLVAAGQLFGQAAALAVLAFEESVKSRTLAAVAVGGQHIAFTEDALSKIIYSGHKERHTAGFYQHLFTEHPGIFSKALTGHQLKADEGTLVTELLELLDSANRKKQAGFYTDFDPDSSSWGRPADITKAEFDNIRALAEAYQAETERQVQNFPAGQ
ncbi:AbiV family abortive infection protein [Kitasatospora sp. NPDC048722]|uniref:AbiV family abortive infection protein n=1 Tax=Kitasatospora sp. NPDC048722 TaxID=3155639 RepID=UPI0034108FFE